MAIDKKAFIVRNLRRISYKWPPRSAALREARIERGVYVCNMCGENFRSKEIVVDHIECVIDPEVGWVDYNTYVERLFCDQNNMQVLCHPCHDYKSCTEQEIRKQNRKKNNETKN